MRLQRGGQSRAVRVWGGISLATGSDSTPDNWEDAYTFLLAQFERRRPIELASWRPDAVSGGASRRCTSEMDASDSDSDSAVA